MIYLIIYGVIMFFIFMIYINEIIEVFLKVNIKEKIKLFFIMFIPILNIIIVGIILQRIEDSRDVLIKLSKS